MPKAIPRRCARPGCAEKITKGSFCDQHRRADEKQERQRYGSARERGYTSRWDKYRQAYLSAHPLCVRCLQNNRVTAAYHIDHVRPRSLRPDLFWDERNHQPLCPRCHYRKTEDEAKGLIYQCPTTLNAPLVQPTIVFGPPGSGKSTMVRQSAERGDVVVDLDEIEASLAQRPIYRTHNRDLRPAIEKRNQILRSLYRARNKAWLIVGAPTAQERWFWLDTLKGRGLLLGPGVLSPEDCKQRIAQDERRSDIACTFHAAVDGWYAAYEATAWLVPSVDRVGGV